MTTSETFDENLARVESLLKTIEATTDAKAKAAAQELVAALLDMHREGFARVLANVDGAGDACAKDALLSSLLLLHGLHPTSIEERARAAIASLPHARVVGVVDGVVTVRVELDGTKSPGALVAVVEEALIAACPDAASVKFEGTAATAAAGLVTLTRKAS